jgi:hypothetical protein
VNRTDTVQLVNETSFGDLSDGLNSQPRETLMHQFRLIGYGPDADLHLFNSHVEAGDEVEDLAGRQTEARQIRTYIDRDDLGNRNVIGGGSFASWQSSPDATGPTQLGSGRRRINSG